MQPSLGDVAVQHGQAAVACCRGGRPTGCSRPARSVVERSASRSVLAERLSGWGCPPARPGRSFAPTSLEGSRITSHTSSGVGHACWSAPSGTSRSPAARARSSSPRMPMIRRRPGARPPRGIAVGGLGATLQMLRNVLRLSRSMSAMVKSTSRLAGPRPGCAASVLVEPPMAMSRRMAFSKAGLGGDRCGAAPTRRPSRSSAGSRSTTLRPASQEQLACGRRGWPESVPLPGSESPRASVRQFMELAVNMPEHDPQVGQAERSVSAGPRR